MSFPAKVRKVARKHSKSCVHSPSRSLWVTARTDSKRAVFTLRTVFSVYRSLEVQSPVFHLHINSVIYPSFPFDYSMNQHFMTLASWHLGKDSKYFFFFFVTQQMNSKICLFEHRQEASWKGSCSEIAIPIMPRPNLTHPRLTLDSGTCLPLKAQTINVCGRDPVLWSPLPNLFIFFPNIFLTSWLGVQLSLHVLLALFQRWETLSQHPF